MGKRLYEGFEVDEVTPVQYVGVHTVRWRPEWGQPTIMFREVDDETRRMVDAAPLMVKALRELWNDHRAMGIGGRVECEWCGRYIKDAKDPLRVQAEDVEHDGCCPFAALAAAEGEEGVDGT